MFFRRMFGMGFGLVVIGGLIALGYVLGAGSAGAAVGSFGSPLGTILVILLALWVVSFLFGGMFRFAMMRRWRRYGAPYYGGWGHWGHKGYWGHHRGRIRSGEGYWEWREGDAEGGPEATGTRSKDAPAGV